MFCISFKPYILCTKSLKLWNKFYYGKKILEKILRYGTDGLVEVLHDDLGVRKLTA